ncbi:MAG: hypothetical protein N2235_02965 [Fischerella sp.]|nr:hypothetical protein [Fischerella sp.]
MTSKGILIYAHNTSRYNYVNFANIAAKLASNNLNLPVSIITNSPNSVNFNYDQIIYQEVSNKQERYFYPNQKNEWFNTSRYTAFDLTPYDQTLLIDADYFIFSNNLSKVFDSNLEFACYDTVHDLVENQFNNFKKLGFSDATMCWATVIFFRKTQFSKLIFNFINYVHQHWDYYSNLYNFDPGIFRNDFALTIALHVLTESSVLSNENKLPGALINVYQPLKILKVKDNKEIILGCNEMQNSRYFKISNLDIHLMDKDDLASNINGFNI